MGAVLFDDEVALFGVREVVGDAEFLPDFDEVGGLFDAEDVEDLLVVPDKVEVAVEDEDTSLLLLIYEAAE